MPRFCANIGFLFPELPFLERFEAARRAGFDAVEFAIPYGYPAEELAARLARHSLQCALINLPMGERKRGEYGLACRPERREDFRAGVAQAIGYARALGVPRMNCIGGLVHEGEDRAALETLLVDNLAYAAREMERAGLELTVEPLNAVDVPGFIAPRCGDVAALLERVGAPNARLQCDLYHAAMMGDDPAAMLVRHRDRIGHIQFADVPGRGEPGSGSLDFGMLFAAIDAIGYPGWVGAEYRPTRPTSDTLLWLER